MELITIIPLLIIVVALIIVFTYNKFIRLRVQSEEAWADIDVQLKRRYDLIPNLVETVKGYATHESRVFEDISKARSQAMQATTPHEHSLAENQLSTTLKSLFAVSEAYPDLKANQNFLELQRELSDTENKIQASRRFYNSIVRDYGITLQSFPSNIIARMFGFTQREFFELEETSPEKEVVKVQF